ncbi:hypothetical protein SGRIM128S_08945 [Streptomyces griseomycini]
MREFDYRRADDVPGAVALLGADPDARSSAAAPISST